MANAAEGLAQRRGRKFAMHDEKSASTYSDPLCMDKRRVRVSARTFSDVSNDSAVLDKGSGDCTDSATFKRASFRASVVSTKKKMKSSPFKVAIPKRLPTPIQESTFDLSSLGKSIDEMLGSPPEGVKKIDKDKEALSSPTYAQYIISYLKKLMSLWSVSSFAIEFGVRSNMNEVIAEALQTRWRMAREKKFTLPESLLYKTTPIKPSARAVLVDWIVQVQDHLELSTETLHLTMALLDNFLSLCPVSLNKVQLIGVTCFLIACKVVERYPPDMKILLQLTENSYKRHEMKAAERLVLKTLKFDVVLPTPVTFMDRCIQASSCDVDKKKLREIRLMAGFLLEHCFTNYRVMVTAPSLRASAATWLARRLLLPPAVEVWSRELIHYSGYAEKEVLPVVMQMGTHLLKRDTSKFKAAYHKYRSRSRHDAVSAHPSLAHAPKIMEMLAKHQENEKARSSPKSRKPTQV